MKRFLILSLVALSLTACSRVQGTLGSIGIGGSSANRATVEFEGTRFKAKAKADSDDKRLVSITVKPVAVNPDGAREAGRYEATRYCLLTYGGSDKDWIISPDSPLEDLPIADDTLTLQARCTQR